MINYTITYAAMQDQNFVGGGAKWYPTLSPPSDYPSH